MARPKSLNKTQIYAIRWLNSQNKTIKEISDELDITENQIQKTLEKYSSTKTENSNTIKDAKSPVSRSQNLMIRETSGKKTNNVAIMTREASEVNDHFKNNIVTHPTTEKAIFRPRQ